MKLNKKYAELLGIMAGDGCLSKTARNKCYVYISSNSETDVEHMIYVQSLFKDLFNRETTLHKRKDENTIVLKFIDKKIFYELSKHCPIGKKYDKLQIPDSIKGSKTFMTWFIRGLFDTDGNVTLSKQHRTVHYYPRIEIRGITKQFLTDVLNYLRNLGFYGSLSKGYCNSYRLEVPGFKNLVRWCNMIGSSNPKQIRKIKAALKNANARDRVRTCGLQLNRIGLSCFDTRRSAALPLSYTGIRK